MSKLLTTLHNYNSDLSASYTTRSLVDKEYVDGLYTFGNGLTNTGGTITLGNTGVFSNVLLQHFGTTFELRQADTVTDAPIRTLVLGAASTGTAVAGFGTGITFSLSNSVGALSTAGYLDFVWIDPTSGSVDSKFVLRTVENNTASSSLEVLNTGQMVLPNYGGTGFTGTATKWLAVDASGNIIQEDPPSGGGTTNNTTTGYVPYYSGTAWENSPIFRASATEVLIGTATSPALSLDNKLYLEGTGTGPTGRTAFVVQNKDASGLGASTFRLLNNSGEALVAQCADSSYTGGHKANIGTSGGIHMYITTDGHVASGGTAPIYFQAGGFSVTPQLVVNTNGSIDLAAYGIGTFDTTDPVYLLGVDATGTVYETQIDDLTAAGTFTTGDKLLGFEVGVGLVSVDWSDVINSVTTLYSGNGTVGSGRIATLTDTLTFDSPNITTTNTTIYKFDAELEHTVGAAGRTNVVAIFPQINNSASTENYTLLKLDAIETGLGGSENYLISAAAKTTVLWTLDNAGRINSLPSLSQSTGDEVAWRLAPTIAKATSGSYKALEIDITETTVHGGDYAIDVLVGASRVFAVSPSGLLTLADGVRQTFNPDATNAGLNVGSHTADPSSLLNGDLFYNSTTNQLKAYINGTAVALGVGAPPVLTEGLQVVYVSKHGSDSNDGLDIENSKLTIASALTAAGSLTGEVRIEVLDGGTYTESITIDAGEHLHAPAATLVGTISLASDASVKLFAQYASANNQTLVNKSGGTGRSSYEAFIVDTRGTGGTLTGGTGVANGTNGSVLFVKIGVLYVGENGEGITDGGTGFGHIHFNIPDLYLAGNAAVGLSAGISSTNLIGYIDHILEINAPTSTVAIDITNSGAIVKLTASEIIADTAYNITNGALHLVCPKITGTRTGTPIAELSDVEIRLQPSANITIGTATIIDDNSGLTTLQNIDALDVTTEDTIASEVGDKIRRTIGVTSISSSVTINSTNQDTYAGEFCYIDSTSGAVTITLDDSVTVGRTFSFVWVAGANVVSFAADTGATIISKNSNLKLSAIGSAATATKYTSTNFALVGDLIT